MILALRNLARLLVFVVLVAIALAGLAAAIFCIGNGDSFSLSALAGYLQLPELRDLVGGWLDDLEADGVTAWWTVLGGACAMLVGLLLLVGLLAPRRERLVQLDTTEVGRLATRRRPLARAAEALALQQRGVTKVRARVRTSRWGRGKLMLRTSRRRDVDPAEVESRAGEAVKPLAEAFHLRLRVRSRQGEGAARVS
jgi:hypothetical protein